MTTITLKQAASYDANAIILMTAQPMNVNLVNLAGGAIQFSCTNPLATIQGATSVNITFDAAHGGAHQDRAVSSVIA